MDEYAIGILTKVLDENELVQVPKKIRKKVENYFEHHFGELLTSKALGETARNNLDEVREKFEKQVSELTSQIQDYEAKLEHSQQNVNELREQLDTSRLEVTKLLESTNRYEAELNELRRDRNQAVDERDSLLKTIERRNTEVERLQEDNKTLEGQLKQAIHVKCEALAKIDEILSKEITLDFKEKRMEQERAMLTNQIQTLSEDLNRNIAELQTIRRDNTMRNLELDTKLNEKTEELKIANSQISHLNETVGSLTTRAEDLATKLLQQHEESNKMMEYYKKELHAKTKLADLYKDSSDDKVEETNELSAAITDLKKMLSDATEQYGEIETKLKSIELKHEQDMEEKQQQIQSLQEELKNANDILKDAQSENLENAIAKIAPSAAASSRLIKTDMSLTELYTKFFKATEDVQYEKNENKKLELQLKTILQELEEKAPIIRKQSLDYQKVLEANQELTNQLENLITEKVEGRHDMEEAMGKIGLLERENKKLKIAQTDLARQVCYLLKEVEQVRGGFCSENEQSISSDMNADEVISKRLVTFGKITELQDNNQKLLLLVRDLSSKLEEMEEIQNNIDQASYESKINNYTKRINEMQQSLEQQSEMLNLSLQKVERYKKLYYDVLKINATNNKIGASGADGSIGSDHMDGIDEEPLLVSNSSSIISTNEAIAGKEKRIIELDELNKELKQQIKSTKDEHDDYIKEKKINEKMMNEQFDSMRTELRELTSTNCKLMSQVEYNNEQIKIQQKNSATYKKQISTLEDRNKNYECTIIKHEQTIMYLKDETLNSQKKLAHAEVQLQNLKQECSLLKDSQTRLQLERESLHRERQTQHLLMNNLEMIKATFERSETEGKIRLESRLDEATRECSALRRRLQEEQDNFRELTAHLKRQTDTAKERMEEEKAAADKLRFEVANLRSEINTKITQIDDLSKKLQESLTPSKNDNPIAQANKKAREFEIKYEEAKLSIELLQKDIETVRENANHYCKMSQSSEQDLSKLNETYQNYKTESETQINKLRLSEDNLKSRVDELETEIRLQITDAQINNGSATNQVQKVQNELKQALQKLSENSRELRDLREQCNLLTSSLQSVEHKYANEMKQHSADIQELVKLKEDLLSVREQISELKSQRDEALSVLEQSKHGFTENNYKIQAEKDELEKRLIDLDAQNSSLHDQIQSLSTKLSLQNAGAQVGNQNDSMNEISSVDTSLINRSINDEDIQKGNDQLLQIIKYLRKEKDIAFAKVDILKSENVRLISEQSMLEKRVNELNSSLNSERTQSESVVVTASRHEEILRKVETLNAVTDSNRILREERDTLSNRVKELTIRVTKVEDELFPLQEKNRELSTKIEECTSENTSLRTEALRWRQRANVLIERSNKNPEEFKRLQNERESLAKMLTAEKEIIRQTNDELNSIRAEKAKLDNEINNLNRQLLNVSEEKKKITDDFNTLKQQNTRLTHEIMELKNQLLQREEDTRKANEEITSKEAQLLDSRNKEMQIRKIAKKYKDSFFELKNKTDGLDNNEGGTITGNSGVGTADTAQGIAGEGGSSSKQDLEQKDKINELNIQIKSLEEEAGKLRKENEEIKLTVEKDDRSKMLLREAKTRIMNLTETKNSIIQELTATKQLLQNNRAETEARISSDYESRITRLEKEYNEQENQIREQMLRLQRENETLLIRVNQLHRQLGMQPKPSTSSGSSSSTDKSATESSSSTSTSTTTNPRTANVKPIGQQSATVTPWRGSETPLASIRPMTVNPNSRTAAILPTSQTPSTAAIQGTSSSSSSSSTNSNNNLTSTGSVTALVPPQQQVHTTAGNSSVEVMSSSPTSSHTDYMPATSSAAVVVATIPPMASSAAVAAESSQEAESVQQDIQQISIALPAAPSTPSASSSSSSSLQQQQMIVSGGVAVVVGPSGSSAATLSSSSSSNLIQGQQQQQTVALVSPRVTDGTQNIVVPQQQQQIIAAAAETNNQPASTSAGSNISSIVVAPSTSATAVVSVSSHHQASSSNTVTTSQAAGGSGTSSHGHKRTRTDVEGDSSTSAEETPEKSHHHHHHHHQPANKRTRIQITGPSEATSVASLSGGVSESGLDVEYQVPTSSQRDQEDDIIIVDSEEDEEDDDDDDEEEDGMADEGNADVDDSGPMEEDEADNGEGYEMESYEQEQDLDENEGPDIDEDNNVPEDTNEVEIDDSCSEQVPNQSTPDAGTSQIIDQSANQSTASTSGQQPQESSSQQLQQQQQIQTISSGSSEAGASVIPQTSSSSGPSGSSTSSWRQNTPLSRQQQATLLMLQQGFNDEAGDDSIVPSTPTLYVPRRTADGFSEAVSSPHPQVPHAARFTFAESPASTAGRQSVGESVAVDDSRVDTGDDNSGRNALSAPLRVTPPRDTISITTGTTGTGSAGTSVAATIGEGSSSTENIQGNDINEPVAGPSHSAEGSTNETEDETNEGASQSEVIDLEQHSLEESEIEEGEGLDGVSSEGEKANTGSEELEEGREAEASISPAINTRSRSVRGTSSGRKHVRIPRGGRPTPIIWQDNNRGGAMNRNVSPNMRGGLDQVGGVSPQRGGNYQMQRGQRARRMRRPSGPNYGGNMRY